MMLSAGSIRRPGPSRCRGGIRQIANRPCECPGAAAPPAVPRRRSFFCFSSIARYRRRVAAATWVFSRCAMSTMAAASLSSGDRAHDQLPTRLLIMILLAAATRRTRFRPNRRKTRRISSGNFVIPQLFAGAAGNTSRFFQVRRRVYMAIPACLFNGNHLGRHVASGPTPRLVLVFARQGRHITRRQFPLRRLPHRSPDSLQIAPSAPSRSMRPTLQRTTRSCVVRIHLSTGGHHGYRYR